MIILAFELMGFFLIFILRDPKVFLLAYTDDVQKKHSGSFLYNLKSCFASVQTMTRAIKPPTIMPINAVTIAPPGRYNATK